MKIIFKYDDGTEYCVDDLNEGVVVTHMRDTINDGKTLTPGDSIVISVCGIDTTKKESEAEIRSAVEDLAHKVKNILGWK